jgi:hypothetical protein
VTTTLSPPIRILALVGVLAVIAAGVLLFATGRSDSDSSSPATPSVATSHSATATPSTGAKPSTATPAKPKVQLLPGLPAPIAKALRNSKVVVVALYARGVDSDVATVASARAGAKSARSGFTAVNVISEGLARKLSTFAGTTLAPPAVLIVKRPGKIVNQFSGTADSTIVAQAAMNAGAGR